MAISPKFLTADPQTLQPNPWNTNHMGMDAEAKLDASIKRLGMFKPVVVRELDDGTLQILGGQHRNESAIRQNMPAVPIVNVGRIDDQRAKEIGIVDNGRYGADDTLELAALLESLGSADELATFLPYSDADFASIFSATSIDLDELELPDDTDVAGAPLPKERAPQTHAVMRFKVPVDDSAWISALIESTKKSQGFDTSDSMTNAGDALVHLLKGMK
ncbi:ParB/RepB/Spo0J family partition protein [Burkholderia gladioli]|uniref:ParB/RepB/Spo0J family partition protein n=1 Tax=Burkholderia gladioli TaxID=28095 RepID=UPI003B50472E